MISFDDSKYSIGRAKRHIAELERQIETFVKTEPYAYVVETDADTGDKIHKYKLVKPMPVDLKGIASDAFQNLRNSLDQSMFALAGRFQYFPFRNGSFEFDRAMDGIRKRLPNEICDLLCGFKPYKGGDNLLWALNAVNNANKHGIITPTAVHGGGPISHFAFWTKNHF